MFSFFRLSCQRCSFPRRSTPKESRASQQALIRDVPPRVVVFVCLSLKPNNNNNNNSRRCGRIIAQTGRTRSKPHILTDIPDASASVDTTVVFPGFGTDLRFPAAEDVVALLGIRNVGDSNIELQAIAGSVNAPQAFHYFVANFSKYEFNNNFGEEEEEEFAAFNPKIGSEKLSMKRLARAGKQARRRMCTRVKNNRW